MKEKIIQKAFYLHWRMWEYILIGMGWLVGYGHPAYYGVKHNRNMAYLKYTLNKR